MAKKRVNGEGTIGKRKDGRWEARYIAGRDPETGKQIRKSILGKTQAEVRTKLKEALAEATEIDVVKSGEYNVAGWVQAWYSLYAQPNVRETTARYYKGYIDHHVLPRLGDIPLNKLTSLDIQQFYKDLLENGRIREDTKAKKPGLSSTTVHGIHVMLKSALKRAVQERLIPFNPAEFCIPPKITKPELQVIPSERYQSYLTAAEQRGVLPMFYLELATGLRKGEIAALLWSDYDAQTQTIHVTKQYLFYNGQGTVSPPKSSTSVRYVSIPEEAATVSYTHLDVYKRQVQTVGYTAHMIFQTASETRQCDGSVFQVFRFQQIVLQPALLPDLQAVGFGSVNRAAERVLYESEFHTSLYRPLM